MATEAACKGKGFEHHQQVVSFEVGGPWSCPDCGDTGSYADFAAYGKRLMRLLPLYQMLQEQMLHEHAVILVPTEAAVGSLGTFLGRDVLRVPGLKEPMIGVRALPFAVDWESVNAELERENGPVAGAERQDVRTEWLGR